MSDSSFGDRPARGPSGDRYRNFAELAREQVEGQDFRIHCTPRDSWLSVIAPHGGGIEPGTLPLARSLAGTEHSFYALEGIRQGGDNNVLHITSHHFDEPRCLELLARSPRVLALHGRATRKATVCVGGRDDEFAQHLAQALEADGFVLEELKRFSGRHPRNICNRGLRHAGVQLELGAPLRTADVRPALVALLGQALRDFGETLSKA